MRSAHRTAGRVSTQPTRKTPATPSQPASSSRSGSAYGRSRSADQPADSDRVPGELVAAFLAEAVRRGVLPAAFTAADLRPMIDVYAVNGQAGSSYRPAGPYPGPLRCLFTLGSGLLSHVDEWRQCALGGVTVDVLDADHFALMHEQHAAEVVDTLRGWL